MKTSYNDITGDLMQTSSSNDAYCAGWERIFGKKELHQSSEEVQLLPTSAFFIQAIEYKRGQGSKPIGYFCFLTENAAKEYNDTQYAKRTSDDPDYYINFSDVGWLQINPLLAQKLIKSASGFVYIEDPYKKGE